MGSIWCFRQIPYARQIRRASTNTHPSSNIQLEISKGTKLKLLSCYTIEGSIQQQTQSSQPPSYEIDLERRYRRNFVLLGDDSGLRSASEMFQLWKREGQICNSVCTHQQCQWLYIKYKWLGLLISRSLLQISTPHKAKAKNVEIDLRRANYVHRSKVSKPLEHQDHALILQVHTVLHTALLLHLQNLFPAQHINPSITMTSIVCPNAATGCRPGWYLQRGGIWCVNHQWKWIEFPVW